MGFIGYMKNGEQYPCAQCGTDVGDPAALIRVEVASKTGRRRLRETWGNDLPMAEVLDKAFKTVCLRCYLQPDWEAREAAEAKRQKAEAANPPPKPYHPDAAKGCTKWPTYEAARERADLVTLYLGVRPNISPVSTPTMAGSGLICQDIDGPQFVVGDSPLVPGFDKNKTKNPLA